MTSIYSYQKYIDNIKTVELVFPVSPETNQRLGDELATINGTTYVSIPDGTTLPTTQPKEIAKTVEEIVLSDKLRADLIATSPLVRVINDMVKDTIRTKYSIEDELKLLRTGPSAEFDEYNNFVEFARSKGREEKAKLGL